MSKWVLEFQLEDGIYHLPKTYIANEYAESCADDFADRDLNEDRWRTIYDYEYENCMNDDQISKYVLYLDFTAAYPHMIKFRQPSLREQEIRWLDEIAENRMDWEEIVGED